MALAAGAGRPSELLNYDGQIEKRTHVPAITFIMTPAANKTIFSGFILLFGQTDPLNIIIQNQIFLQFKYDYVIIIGIYVIIPRTMNLLDMWQLPKFMGNFGIGA
jgi:hypothetical protein